MPNEKHIVIIGSGSAGALLANKLAKQGKTVTVIDDAENHYYQPGFLFLPFGYISIDKLHKPTSSVLNKDIYWLKSKVTSIDTSKNLITTEDHSEVSYDVLVIATGTQIDPSQTEGMQSDYWHKNIFDFYTPDGAQALNQALEQFNGGRIAVQITEMPIKCPVAPLEFSFLLDDFLIKKGLRQATDITFVTPLPGAFTKPVASQKLGHLLEEKAINTVTDFYVEKIIPDQNKLVCYDGREVEYDLLVTIPMNVGAKIMQDQSFTDDLGFVDVDQHTLQSKTIPNVFAIGDATNVATSKAGSVAHFEAEVLAQNIDDYISGRQLSESFDGHSNCFVEVGAGKALLLDFNYETQPYEGKFPFAGIGPMSLLKPSRINHIGKLLFRYIYWYMLIPGRKIPFIPSKMSLKGKKIIKEGE